MSVHAADEAARARLERWGTDLYSPQYRKIAIYHLLTGEPDKAWLVCHRSYEVREDPYVGLHAALIADVLGKTSERDAILKQVVETRLPENYVEAKTQEYYQQLAAQLTQMLPPKSAKELNAAEVEKIQTAAGDKLTGSKVPYFVGAFLKNRGDLENAKKYLIRCAQANDWRTENHVLACQLLREMKVKIPPAP